MFDGYRPEERGTSMFSDHLRIGTWTSSLNGKVVCIRPVKRKDGKGLVRLECARTGEPGVREDW